MPDDEMTDDVQPASDLQGKRIAFVGRLGGVTRRDAQKLLRDLGAVVVDHVDMTVDIVIIGADELPLNEETLLDDSIRNASAEGNLEILNETQLWERIGLFDQEEAGRLYTPAMLAELLDVSVAIIRRWHRRKLIVPVREVRRLPYFDFQEVSTARQLAQLLVAGVSPASIERKLARLARYVPDVERPLAQLSVIVEGKQLLLRQGEGLIEPGGQLRIDFDALDHADLSVHDDHPESTVSLATQSQDASQPTSAREMLQMAERLEDEGQLDDAVQSYRAAMVAGGPMPDVCFQLAELLYRLGDVQAARERYYMAVELDEDYVEARANLGCVLAETGQLELAVAAFKGALRYHREYPDVHYHLARALDELRRPKEAEPHWREFLRLAPNSPWSEQAHTRLDTEDS